MKICEHHLTPAHHGEFRVEWFFDFDNHFLPVYVLRHPTLAGLLGWGGGAIIADGDPTNEAASLIRVYRVEGDVNARIEILDDGLVKITGDNMLFLNFGNAQRALEFFEQRATQGMDGVAIKSFEVSSSFLDYLQSIAVPEQLARQFPDAPIVVDVTRAANQFGLRLEQIKQLMEAVVQGSGRAEHP